MTIEVVAVSSVVLVRDRHGEPHALRVYVGITDEGEYTWSVRMDEKVVSAGFGADMEDAQNLGVDMLNTLLKGWTQ